jgi:hypothetical protein
MGLMPANSDKKSQARRCDGTPPTRSEGIDRCDGATPRAAGRARLLSDATMGNACAFPTCIAGTAWEDLNSSEAPSIPQLRKLAGLFKRPLAVLCQRLELPWATRALFRHVLPAIGVDAIGSVWEPACGEGHMAAVVAEFVARLSRLPIFTTMAMAQRRSIFSTIRISCAPRGSLRILHSRAPANSRCERSILRPKARLCWCARSGSKALGAMKTSSGISRHRSTRRS